MLPGKEQNRDGIGLTAEEIEKYINQIAFSGANDFLEKYKNDANAIIGHFGLGFYSAFMVAKKVEIITKSYRDGAQAVKCSMIAMESGTAFAYAIDKLQDRGKFFIFPQDEVYAGQVVGEHSHDNDLVINVTKSKKLTNMRASGSDDKVRLIPPIQFSLEEALEYIKEDEYVEVTPKAMRMRKVILDEIERKRANKN